MATREELLANMKWRILGMSDSPLGVTGFGTVTRDLFRRLNNIPNYEVTCIGWNQQTQPTKKVVFEDDTEINFPTYPGGKAAYCTDRMPEYFNQFRPHAFFCLLDSFMLYQSGWMGMNIPAKFVMYFPSDGGYFPKDCYKILQKANFPIAMAKFGQEQVKRMHNIDVDYIPHAVDTNHYYPFSEEKKRETRRKWNLPEDAFIVGSVFRNQGRKMADRQMKIFAEFAKDKKNVYAFFNSDPNDPAAPTDLVDLSHRYNIAPLVRWSGMKAFHGLSAEQMKEVYNLMDVHILSTSGEGFGVPIIEAMSAGVPNLITDYTTTKELVIDDIQVGEAIKLVGTEISPYPAENNKIEGTIVGSWNVERGICSIKDGVDKLNKLYYDEALRKDYARNARLKALKYYDWDSVVFPKMWKPFWKKVLES